MTSHLADFGLPTSYPSPGPAPHPLAVKPERKRRKAVQAPVQPPLNPIDALLPQELAVVEAARTILASHWKMGATPVHYAPIACELAKLHLSCLGQERFAAMFLDSNHRLIEFRTLFTGTLKMTPVYPREVARAALHLNAAAVIVAHNHPSGDPEPSAADATCTYRLKEALALVDVQLLDHIIVGADCARSLRELKILRG